MVAVRLISPAQSQEMFLQGGNMFNIPSFYRLEDGRIWSVAKASFVAKEDAALSEYLDSGLGLGTAPDTMGALSATGLRDALAFYGLPLGNLISLTEAQATQRAVINAGFDSAMIASLTMPSTSTPPSAYAVYTVLEEWKTEYPEEFAALLAIHTARRDALLSAVEAAQTAEEVQAITVSYAV